MLSTDGKEAIKHAPAILFAESHQSTDITQERISGDARATEQERPRKNRLSAHTQSTSPEDGIALVLGLGNGSGAPVIHGAWDQASEATAFYRRWGRDRRGAEMIAPDLAPPNEPAQEPPRNAVRLIGASGHAGAGIGFPGVTRRNL
jgi:hypothetical protein